MRRAGLEVSQNFAAGREGGSFGMTASPLAEFPDVRSKLVEVEPGLRGHFGAPKLENTRTVVGEPELRAERGSRKAK